MRRSTSKSASRPPQSRVCRTSLDRLRWSYPHGRVRSSAHESLWGPEANASDGNIDIGQGERTSRRQLAGSVTDGGVANLPRRHSVLSAAVQLSLADFHLKFLLTSSNNANTGSRRQAGSVTNEATALLSFKHPSQSGR